jgi:diadenosine tetraphosphate (Ap4A) HIT family hydrolase
MTSLDKFALAPAFLQTSEPLVSLKLCEARLQADARFPWIVLVPRRAGAREMEHIANGDRAQLMEEIIASSAAVRAIGAAIGRPVERVNVGQIGLKTSQLHIHVVGRRADDECWPEPVWGRGETAAYDAKTLEVAIEAALGVLKAMQAAA